MNGKTRTILERLPRYVRQTGCKLVRILYISNTFPRDEDKSTIYTDLAEELHRRGHNVFVVASEEKRHLRQTGIVMERGLRVLRVMSGNLQEVSLLEKGWSTLTLVPRLVYAMNRYLEGELFDFILFESPPVTMATVVWWAMRHFRCPSYLMLKDIFPQNAVDLEMISEAGPICRLFRHQERRMYETASVIGCMSEANREYLLRHNTFVDPDKVQIFPNTSRIKCQSRRSKRGSVMRRKHSIPEGAVVCVFGGNMGRPQGLDQLLNIALRCVRREDVFFVLVGRGTERGKIRARIEQDGLTNVLLIDSLPRDDYETLIDECDVGLIFLDKRFTIPNFPSKVLSYFEHSLPVLAATDLNTDFGKMIEQAGAGFWSEAGDEDGFIRNMNTLVSDPELRLHMGVSGRHYLEDHYSVGVSVDILERRFGRRDDHSFR